MSPVKAVLFDLDDTLFDHRRSCLAGLAAVRGAYPSLQRKPLDQLERDHLRFLKELYPKIKRGLLSVEDSRAERFRLVFAGCDEAISEATARSAAAMFRQAYEADRRPIPGAAALLQAVKSTATVAVVSNNLLATQCDRLRCCGIAKFVDVLVVSEEVGSAKPDPAIFEAALSKVGCRAEEAVMVGDSWELDVLGARGAGIRAIWLNRYGTRCPDPAIAPEIRSLDDLDAVLALILRAGPSSHGAPR